MEPIVAVHFSDPSCPWADSSRPAIVRPSELEDADLPATEAGLIAAAREGRIVCEPAGRGALWLPPVVVGAA